MNPYEVLQIRLGASPDEVRNAYHQLARDWHPDKFTGAEKQAAEAKFRTIAEAYAAIKKGTVPSQGATIPPMPQETTQEKTPSDWLAEAKAALRNNQYDTAIAMSQYCFNYPQVASEARMVYAGVLEATGKDVKAKARAYEEVIRLNPDNAEAVVKLAELYQALNMPSRAASMRERAKALGCDVKPSQAPLPTGATAQTDASAGIVDKIAGFFRFGANTNRG